MDYLVLRDSQEKKNKGWIFKKYKQCLGTETIKLPTGDYTIDGLQDIFTIERKGSVSEFAKNIVEDRFIRELERMEEFDHPFLLLEFSVDDTLQYPVNSGIPKYLHKSIRIRGPFIFKKISEFQIKYKTKIIWCGDYGKDVASSLFKSMVERYGAKIV